MEDLGERRGGVARAEVPAGAIDKAREGGPAGLGSWTTDADPHRRPSDSIAYGSGSSLRTLVMRHLPSVSQERRRRAWVTQCPNPDTSGGTPNL